MFDTANLLKEQRVLIHGAAGSVGSFAVQFAKLKGAYVIGTAAADAKEYLSNLGADEVIDYKASRFEDLVHDIDVVLDTIGGDVQERSWKVLKPSGTLVATTSPPSAQTAAAIGVQGKMVNVRPSKTILTEIARLLDSGQIKTNVGTILPLAEVRQAHELSQHGHSRGKIVLQVGVV